MAEVKFLSQAGVKYLWNKLKDTFVTKTVAVTHTENTAVGTGSKGIYSTADGTLVEMAYSVNTDVPSTAVFTDTTYTSGIGLELSGTQFRTKRIEVALANADYSAGYLATVPAYIGGMCEVNVYINGAKCRRGDTFSEVDATGAELPSGTQSTTIKFNDAISSEYDIEVVVG